uniref:Uncharacterized protein n=1 Tax=Brassica campestris TaxID=3711 RepID=M4DIT7_BRACM
MDDEEVDNKKDYDVEYDPTLAAAPATGTSHVCDSSGYGYLLDSESSCSNASKVEYIRCAMSDYGCYNVTKPPIDAPRDPLYKSEREISKVFLTKHYRNRRSNDPEFVLALEEIYVIDSKSKSITRARVLVTVPGGRKRDRKDDLLVIRDNENSFKIIHVGERDDPTTVIEREEWTKTREDMEKHLRKLRDFSVSNWF